MADGHEGDIADWIGGSLQKSSGNQWHAQGDVKNGEYLTPLPVTGDGKATMHASVSIKRSDWAKLVEQTFGQNPVLFHRFYRPGTGPLVAEMDLATVSVEFFCELLEAARKWKEFEEYPRAIVDGKHLYLSTGCLHGNHAYCQNKEGQAGPKTPGVCKHCSANCLCSCHGDYTGCDCCR